MKPDLTIWRTPNIACPACQMKCVHSKELLLLYHPFSGHGFTGTAWTHVALEPAVRWGGQTSANAYTEHAQRTQGANHG